MTSFARVSVLSFTAVFGAICILAAAPMIKSPLPRALHDPQYAVPQGCSLDNDCLPAPRRGRAGR